MSKILYADDDLKYRKLINIFLSNQGHDVLTAVNGLKLLELYDSHRDADLIILDVMMPEMNGIETCSTIRQTSNIPILMLTALGEIHDEVKGLKEGADEYIAKPFSNEKLVARINALLRRTVKQDEEFFSEEGYTFNDTLLLVSNGNKSIRLTQKEFLLFKTLLKNKGQILSRGMLMDRVWGLDYYGDPRTVDTHIKTLRQKLEDDGINIETSWGVGYYYRSNNHEE
ncbi:response regulator transcription factor [Clostridium sp.]|uniref:response regulator transcription factor n=1 Tax=Clostridium sp. TaxID=1506 RepID=UPI001A5E04C9|nr:response regulator transcription factor [Clostridium sp.]MBK5242369.1 response regulator transcription factor [Clostridium sp.]